MRNLILLALGVMSGCFLSAQPRLYFSELNFGYIGTLDLTTNTYKQNISANRPVGIAVDEAAGKIYWSDAGQNAIISMNLDGTERTTLLSGTSSPYFIALDASSGVLYFSTESTVERVNTDGSNPRVLVSNANRARGLTIDPARELVYFSEFGTQSLKSVKFDGTGLRTVFSNFPYAYEMAFSADANQIFYSVYTGAIPGSGIFSTPLSSFNATTIIEDFVSGFHVDDVHDLIYWSEATNNRLHKTDLDGNNEAVVLSGIFDPGTMVSGGDGTLYFIDKRFGDFLHQVNADGTGRKILASTQMYRPVNFAVDTVGKTFFWNNSKSSYSNDENNSIYRCALDGTDVQLLVPKDSLGIPAGIEGDFASGKLYYSDVVRKGIYGMNVDGSQRVPLINPDSLSSPRDISLDLVNQKIYWTDWSQKSISRANLDGSEIERLVTGLNTPGKVILDTEGGKMYWADQGARKIQRSDLNGQNLEDLITLTTFENPINVTLDLDAGKLYWAEGFRRKIRTANLDGSDIEDILVLPLYSTPAGIFFENQPIISAVEAPHPESASLRVWPNPASTKVRISCKPPVTGEAQIQLLDGKAGSVMADLKVSLTGHQDQEVEFQLPSGLGQGIYYLQLTQGKFRATSRLIVIE